MRTLQHPIGQPLLETAVERQIVSTADYLHVIDQTLPHPLLIEVNIITGKGQCFPDRPRPFDGRPLRLLRLIAVRPVGRLAVIAVRIN